MQETEIDRMLRQMQETYRALDAAPLQLQRDRAAHEKALRLQAEYEDLKKAAAALTAETARTRPAAGTMGSGTVRIRKRRSGGPAA